MAAVAVEGGVVTRTRVRAGVRDVIAGAICSVLSVAYGLSYAALIFSGPLASHLSTGIVTTFVSAALAAGIVGMRSSIPFAIAGPDTSTSAVMATLVAAMVARLAAEGRADLLPPVTVLIALATAATGVLLCVLGFTRVGQAIRFVPYPVIGGFLGATGWMMVRGAIQVTTGRRFALDDVASLAAGPVLGKLLAGLAVALVLQLLLRRWNNAFVLPVVLLASMAAIHFALPLSGVSLADAQARGWMFQPQPAAPLALPWSPAVLATFPWSSMTWLVGDLLAVMFVTSISLLLNVTGVEIATRREADIGRELGALGVANLVSAACGGYVGCLSLSRTTLAHAAGAAGRLAGVTVALLSAAMLVIDPGFLGFVPRYALGGLLFFAGLRLLYHWTVGSASRLPLLDYLSLVAIALIIIQWGFIAGVLIGIVIGCATFAVSVSRVNAVKFHFDGSEYRSSLDRSPSELALLVAHGRELQGMALQSYLFFGSANRLYEQVKALLADRAECRYLLFDFRLVTGVDSSATHSFAQIRDVAAAHGTQLVLVSLSPALERAFEGLRLATEGAVVVEDLDRALEFCEEGIIAAHRAEAAGAPSLVAWLSKVLGGRELAVELAGYCQRLDVQAGEDIARQGDASDSMHFIVEGRVGIFVDLGSGRPVRLRSLGRHTTVGEMGLITGRPRSATIRAESASLVYALPADAYSRILHERPVLGLALYRFVIEVLAERLNFANRSIGVLQR